MRLTEFRDVLLTVDPKAFHYEASQKLEPYTVWAEEDEKQLSGDDACDEVIIRARVDYFTQTEYDPQVEVFKAAFNGMDIAYRYSCEYDTDAKVIHHRFDCEVA